MWFDRPSHISINRMPAFRFWKQKTDFTKARPFICLHIVATLLPDGYLCVLLDIVNICLRF